MSDETTTDQRARFGEADDAFPVEQFEAMNKNERIAHLREYHHMYLNNASRYSVDELDRLHSRQHLALATATRLTRMKYGDSEVTEWHIPRGEHTPHDRTIQTKEHVHEAGIEAAIEDGTLPKEVLEQAMEKPLNASQKRELKALIDNDFAATRKEIEQFAQQRVAEAVKAVEDEFAAKEGEVQDWHAQIDALVTEGRKEYAEFKERWLRQSGDLAEQAKAAGFALVVPTPWEYGQSGRAVTVIGRQEAINKASGTVRQELERAKIALERQRLAAQRQIMLAGLPKESLDLLAKVPTAKQMLAAVASTEQEPEQIEA